MRQAQGKRDRIRRRERSQLERRMGTRRGGRKHPDTKHKRPTNRHR